MMANADDEKENDDAIKETDSKPIGARDDCNGSILTLSFQIKAADDKKVYLYWNGMVLPFEPSYLRDILPLIFDMKSEENLNFMEKEKGMLDRCTDHLNTF